MATNASRFRSAAGKEKTLLEFGLRRAQGPDGGVSASRYSYLGGFDGTSNVLAGSLFGIPCRGTHAHAFVSSFTTLDEVRGCEVAGVDLAARALHYLRENGWDSTASESELAAFVSYARSFPDGLLALVDTYDTLAVWWWWWWGGVAGAGCARGGTLPTHTRTCRSRESPTSSQSPWR